VDAPVIANTIAYIYKTDNADALAYKTLLEANNCAVTLIEKANAVTTDYSKYKLIVIDNNTDVIGASQFWTTTDVNTIVASGKQILLIGAGGLQFAAKNGNIINWGQNAQSVESSIYVLDPTSTLFSRPKTVAVNSTTKELIIYSTAYLSSGQYIPTGTLANVTLLCKYFSATNTNYYPVSFEKSRYGFFGFYKGTSLMTQAGQDFMVNYTYYIGGLTL
jgi:hypothetical protein